MWLQWLRTEASESSTKSSTQGLPDAWEPSGDTGVNLQGFRFFGAVGWQDSGRFALWNGEGMAQVGWGRADISCGHPKLGSWNEIELQFQPRSRKGWSALELSWLRFVRIIIVLAVQYGKEVYVLTFSKFLKRFHWNTCNVFHFYCSMYFNVFHFIYWYSIIWINDVLCGIIHFLTSYFPHWILGLSIKCKIARMKWNEINGNSRMDYPCSLSLCVWMILVSFL